MTRDWPVALRARMRRPRHGITARRAVGSSWPPPMPASVASWRLRARFFAFFLSALQMYTGHVSECCTRTAVVLPSSAPQRHGCSFLSRRSRLLLLLCPLARRVSCIFLRAASTSSELVSMFAHAWQGGTRKWLGCAQGMENGVLPRCMAPHPRIATLLCSGSACAACIVVWARNYPQFSHAYLAAAVVTERVVGKAVAIQLEAA